MKAVHVKTQAEYDTLMRAYEVKGYVNYFMVRPTQINQWPCCKENTCIDFRSAFRYGHESSYQINGYEIITLQQALKELNMNELETLQVGDLVKTRDGCYRRILIASGEGELRVYGLSGNTNDLAIDDLKRHGLTYTAFELKERGFSLYSPSETIEVDGKKYKKSDVEERLKELKPVE